jgi:hypothetical protein
MGPRTSATNFPVLNVDTSTAAADFSDALRRPFFIYFYFENVVDICASLSVLSADFL